MKNITPESNGYIYGLVLLNYDNVVTLGVTTDEEKNTTVTFGKNTLDAGSTTFATMQGYTSSVTDATSNNPYIVVADGKKYFYMSNTVLSSVAGGMSAPTAQLSLPWSNLVQLSTTLRLKQ